MVKAIIATCMPHHVQHICAAYVNNTIIAFQDTTHDAHRLNIEYPVNGVKNPVKDPVKDP